MNLFVITRNGRLYTGYMGGGSGAPMPNCLTDSFRQAVKYDSMEAAIQDAIWFHGKVVDDSGVVFFASSEQL